MFRDSRNRADYAAIQRTDQDFISFGSNSPEQTASERQAGMAGWDGRRDRRNVTHDLISGSDPLSLLMAMCYPPLRDVSELPSLIAISSRVSQTDLIGGCERVVSGGRLAGSRPAHAVFCS